MLNFVVSHKICFCTSVIYRDKNSFEVSCSVLIYENQFRKHWTVPLALYKGPSMDLYFYRAVEKPDRCLEN